jgi:hypothetical protein
VDATPAGNTNARDFLRALKKSLQSSYGTEQGIFDLRTPRFDRKEDLGLTKKAPEFEMNRFFPCRVRTAQASWWCVHVRILCLLHFLIATSGGAKEQPVGAGMVREFPATVGEVRQAVRGVVSDQIIHGTKIFDKDPILTGAEAVPSTPLFAPWEGPGEVFYKIRQNAVAPRHFLDSADQGTIGVRYVIIPVNDQRTRVRIDAVYVEASHHGNHISDGTVEKNEMMQVKERLEAAQQAAQEAAEAKRRMESAAVVHQTYVRQREDETSRLNDSQAAEKQLDGQVKSLRHQVERRVKAPGTDLKAAPFQAAATLKTLSAYTDVLVLIITPHWLGVETAEGQRGWIPEDRLEMLP